MPVIVEIDEFLSLGNTIPTVDVRSPAEFEHGHIPGAVNIPIFSNEERSVVGTLFKHQGHDYAFAEGLKIVGPKLAEFVELGQKSALDGKILVHCWRGGKRSSSMAQLFESAGLQTWLLKGGYKSYRQHVLTSTNSKFDIRIVGGQTGSGKTEILHALHSLGEQIIDLEGIASHRGSAFGSLGMDQQPQVEQFENRLTNEFSKIVPTRRVWLEDESRNIGRVYIPPALWSCMESAPVYRIQIPFEIRVQRLIKDYGDFSKEQLMASLDKIKKRLGGLDYKNALDALENGDLTSATKIALHYYDKAYDHPRENKIARAKTVVECSSGDPLENAKKILEILQ